MKFKSHTGYGGSLFHALLKHHGSCEGDTMIIAYLHTRSVEFELEVTFLLSDNGS